MRIQIPTLLLAVFTVVFLFLLPPSFYLARAEEVETDMLLVVQLQNAPREVSQRIDAGINDNEMQNHDSDASIIKIRATQEDVSTLTRLHNKISSALKLPQEFARFHVELIGSDSKSSGRLSEDNFHYVAQHRKLFHLSLVFQSGQGLREEERLAISGRLFDTADGLTINGRHITIREKINDPHDSSVSVNSQEGTGVSTWDGSIVLSKYLEKNPQLVQGKSCLELGAGTGVAGMASAALGASKVLVTDLEYTLINLVYNVQSSFQDMSSSAVSNTEFYFSKEDIVSDDHKNFQIGIQKLDWKDKSTYAHEQGPWEVIIGADVVWLEDLVYSLVQTIHAHANAGTTIIIAHQTRSLRADEVLMTELGKYFDVTKVGRSEHVKEFQNEKIDIFIIKLRSGASKQDEL